MDEKSLQKDLFSIHGGVTYLDNTSSALPSTFEKPESVFNCVRLCRILCRAILLDWLDASKLQEADEVKKSSWLLLSQSRSDTLMQLQAVFSNV